MTSSLASTEDSVVVRPATADDVEQITDIYNHYVQTSTITFEEAPVDPSEMARRILEVRAIPLPWLAAARDDEVLGYAYASKWKTRAAYKFSVEVTIYLRTEHVGAGVGTRLYKQLLDALKGVGVHAAICGVALPNDASLRLHRKLGFEQVAHFKEVGFKLNRWIDVTYWEVILRP